MSAAIYPDATPQPDRHPALSPAEGSVSVQNPPAFVWRVDDRAESYSIEMSTDPEFGSDVVRVDGIDMPFYNGPETLPEGTWYWRYTIVLPDGLRSHPSSVRSFRITSESVPLPVPPTSEILSRMPDHPRIFVTPATLDTFRSLRNGTSKEVWIHLRHTAEDLLKANPPEVDRLPMPTNPGEDRGQVFGLQDGAAFLPAEFDLADLKSAADRVNTLSYAYLISGDDRYARAAVRWMVFVSQFRVDLHLEDRGQHDTVVYCYEYGLKGMALGYDRVGGFLNPGQKQRVLDHIEYHCENAIAWIRDGLQIHLNYQTSHGQQCMHALLTTVLAVATDIPQAAGWSDYLIRQYVNRIAWGNNDGGYTEGQKYGHKVRMILEALAALKSSTGLDLFQTPRWRNSGDFWLYCMSMNYWWNHWGDCYSLIDPNFGSDADTYIAGLLASQTGNRYVKWYGETRVTNPVQVPFWYMSGTDVQPRPPVDIPQARAFLDVGQLAAFDRFYDHGSNRIFFRSSPWGSHSHSHSDQNGFILHAGGEILACDAGYYTYSGDDYSRKWSQSTAAHNSLLVDGEGQPKGITHDGRITRFLNSPDYCLFTGDAGDAYEDRLEAFDRTVLFIRPDIWIIHDSARAPEPARFTWTLNTFEAAEIDPDEQKMIVRQRAQRLAVHHLSPDRLGYTQNGDRPFPMKTRSFTRFTEAFPQQWNIRVTTSEKAENGRILSLLHAYGDADGPAIDGISKIQSGDALGVRYVKGSTVDLTLLRGESGDPLSVDGVESDADVVSLYLENGSPVRWLIQNGTYLTLGGKALWRSDQPGSAVVNLALSSATAQVILSSPRESAVTFPIDGRPKTVLQAPPNRPAEGQPVDTAWENGLATVRVDEGDRVLWIDPVADLTRAPGPVALEVTDSGGVGTIDLEPAWTRGNPASMKSRHTTASRSLFRTTGTPISDRTDGD